ncbi:hypothetical protein BurJ1DRAFT_2299 [Burkholderiales bacterium JOSHI_001]|nr:hypothetical protein BurJ1DRAFT_2299 [Burkholderiales bacterium JOSHI_001]
MKCTLAGSRRFGAEVLQALNAQPGVQVFAVAARPPTTAER